MRSTEQDAWRRPFRPYRRDMRLLLVEDEPKLADIVRRATQRFGWSVDVVDNGTDAIWQATEFEYDVIVLDVGIPAPDGFEVCRRLRAEECWTPILFLTARDDIGDRVTGLDAGGDDYLTKPFAIDELNARLRALSRRTLGERPSDLRAGDLVLSPATRTVMRDGHSITGLSAKEFAVLELLMRRAGEVVSRTALLDHAWDMSYDGASNVVDVNVKSLRDKIDRPFGRHSIETIRGAGYRLNGSSDPS